MKLLLDTCVWGGAQKELEAAGHDVIWGGDWPKDPGDDEILKRAHQEQRILVTLDKDFGELAIAQHVPHSGIIRLVNLSARKHAAVCLEVLRLHGEELQSGALVTAEADRLRIRFPDLPTNTGMEE
jgi:predicted nuclease of predicted toxin-antitoxin system